MSLKADHVMIQSHIGSSIMFGYQIMAKIIHKNDHRIEIKDIHGKHWLIDQSHLSNVKYSVFLRDLATAITRFCPYNSNKVSAQRVLTTMAVGDELRDDHGSLATLIDIDPYTDLGPSLTFKDVNGNQQCIYLYLIPNDLDFEGYLNQFRQYIEDAIDLPAEPLLLRYFRHEFIPKMLSQMNYDHEKWGDTWQMQPRIGQEKLICEHFNKYFEYFEHYGRDIPWVKVAGYAIIAQAREDHPEWLL